LSAVSTATCLQIAATAPNFVPQEYPNDSWGVTDKPPDSDSFLIGSAQNNGEGFFIINDEPAIGVTLRPDAQEKFPYRPREILTRLHKEGSVVDQ
jgi:galactonate dehydratase